MDWGDQGGFIADEPQQIVSSVSVGGDEKNKAIAPVSISQIVKLTRPNEGLVIHGRKIYYVCLVAMVHEVVDQTHQKICLLLDDYTSGGPLEANHVIGDAGSPEDSISTTQIKIGDYVRCVGVIKAGPEKPILVVYNIRIVDDPNTVTLHILNVIDAYLTYADTQANPGRLPVETPAAPMNNQVRQVNDGFGKLSTREKHVLKFLQEMATSDEGLHMDIITKHFKAFSKSEIEQSLTTLSAEGFCWQGDIEELWCVNRTDF